MPTRSVAPLAATPVRWMGGSDTKLPLPAPSHANHTVHGLGLLS